MKRVWLSCEGNGHVGNTEGQGHNRGLAAIIRMVIASFRSFLKRAPLPEEAKPKPAASRLNFDKPIDDEIPF